MLYLNSVAPKDGTTIGLVHSSVPFAPLYRIRGAQVNFRPNFEIKEICFADPQAPPAGCTQATEKRLAELAGAKLSPYW